jgi:hypothetical protein
MTEGLGAALHPCRPTAPVQPIRPLRGQLARKRAVCDSPMPSGHRILAHTQRAVAPLRQKAKFTKFTTRPPLFGPPHDDCGVRPLARTRSMGTGVKAKMVPDRSGSLGSASGAGGVGAGVVLIGQDGANCARVGKGFLGETSRGRTYLCVLRLLPFGQRRKQSIEIADPIRSWSPSAGRLTAKATIVPRRRQMPDKRHFTSDHPPVTVKGGIRNLETAQVCITTCKLCDVLT